MTAIVRFPVPPSLRLERVRALRERAEDQAKEEYAASLAHRLDGVAMLRAAAADRDRARAVSRPVEDMALSGADLIAAQAWLDRLERAREAAALGSTAATQRSRPATPPWCTPRASCTRAPARSAARQTTRSSARLESAELDELAAAGHRRRTAS